MIPLKWSVPIGGGGAIVGAGDPLLVACQNDPSTVELWTEEPDLSARAMRVALVVPTGTPAPQGWEHMGSTVTAEGLIVWHLYREPPPF